jgi:trimeric autotransporter adhesin
MKRVLLFISLFILTIESSFAQSGIINTIAGNGRGIDSGDGGLAVHAALNWPQGVTVDDSGNIYIAEFNGDQVRRINSTGIITTIAGNGVIGTSGDGGPATAAELNYPTGVCTDVHGDLYIADFENQVIRKVNVKTGIIHKIAGLYGVRSSTGDGGQASAATLNYPMGIFVDKIGNIYIADHTNNKIRKIDTSDIITTVAGNEQQGFGGDGGLATAAELYFPSSVCTDSFGNIIIADTYNQRVRKIDIVTGIISSVAGSGPGYSGQGFSGDGGFGTAAELDFPFGVSVDKTGNIYIADDKNNRIREVNVSGIINTIVGDGTPGFSGDGGQATLAELNLPCGVALDSANNIYIVDGQNMRIRKVNAITTGIPHINNNDGISIFPNPSNGTFTLSLSNVNEKCTVEIYNIVGEKIYTETIQTQNNNTIDLTGRPNGMYFYRVLKETGELVGSGKIIIEK